jgi:hypothetical protein
MAGSRSQIVFTSSLVMVASADQGTLSPLGNADLIFDALAFSVQCRKTDTEFMYNAFLRLSSSAW